MMQDVPLDFGNQFIADNNHLEKQGRVGKFVARNRSKVKIVAFGLMALGLLPVLWFALNIISIPFLTVAAGLSYFKDPHSVKLPNGIVVHEVHQPLSAVTSSSQAAMVMSDVQAKREDRRLLDESLVKQGFLQWRVVSRQPLHNFTLDGMKPLLKRNAHEDNNTCACLCYVNFGIAENIVYVVESEEILYEPRVISRAAANFTGETKVCTNTARSLIAAAAPSKAGVSTWIWGVPETRVALSGIVHYVTHSGKLNQRNFKQPQLACIDECIGYFQ